jgi:hypothetical protein
MFRTVPLSIIRSSFTVHSAMVYVIQVCRQLSSSNRMELQFHSGPVKQVCRQLSSRTRMELQFHPDPARKLSANLYDIAECTVNKLLTMDRGTVRNMWSFMSKQICDISASSWFYYKEICYDARSHDCKKKYCFI